MVGFAKCMDGWLELAGLTSKDWIAAARLPISRAGDWNCLTQLLRGLFAKGHYPPAARPLTDQFKPDWDLLSGPDSA